MNSLEEKIVYSSQYYVTELCRRSEHLGKKMAAKKLSLNFFDWFGVLPSISINNIIVDLRAFSIEFISFECLLQIKLEILFIF